MHLAYRGPIPKKISSSSIIHGVICIEKKNTDLLNWLAKMPINNKRLIKCSYFYLFLVFSSASLSNRSMHSAKILIWKCHTNTRRASSACNVCMWMNSPIFCNLCAVWFHIMQYTLCIHIIILTCSDWTERVSWKD